MHRAQGFLAGRQGFCHSGDCLLRDAHALFAAGHGRLVVVEQAHAIDEGEGQLGLGLPRVGAEIPLGRTAIAELPEEGLETLMELGMVLQFRNDAIDPRIKQGCQAGVGTHHARQIPHGVRRLRRNDVTSRSHEIEGRQAHLGRDERTEHRWADGRLGSTHELTAPGHALIWSQTARICDKGGVAHLAEVGTLGAKAIRDAGVFLDVGEGRGRQRPLGPLGQALRDHGITVVGMVLVRRGIRVTAEELRVDGLPAKTTADTRQARTCHVDVHMAIAEGGCREGFRIHIGLGHRDGAHIRVSIGEAREDVGIPDEVSPQGRDGVRQDVVGVEPGVDREALVQLGAVDAPVVADLSGACWLRHRDRR